MMLFPLNDIFYIMRIIIYTSVSVVPNLGFLMHKWSQKDKKNIFICQHRSQLRPEALFIFGSFLFPSL